MSLTRNLEPITSSKGYQLLSLEDILGLWNLWNSNDFWILRRCGARWEEQSGGSWRNRRKWNHNWNIFYKVIFSSRGKWFLLCETQRNSECIDFMGQQQLLAPHPLLKVFVFQWHVFWNILWLAVQVLGVSAIVAHPIVSHLKIYPLFLESSIFVMGHGYLTRIVFSVRYCHEHLAMCMIHRCFCKMFYLSLCMCGVCIFVCKCIPSMRSVGSSLLVLWDRLSPRDQGLTNMARLAIQRDREIPVST